MVYFSHKQKRGVCYEKISTIKMDCLLLREVEFDEDGDVVNCEYLDIRYPEN